MTTTPTRPAVVVAQKPASAALAQPHSLAGAMVGCLAGLVCFATLGAIRWCQYGTGEESLGYAAAGFFVAGLLAAGGVIALGLALHVVNAHVRAAHGVRGTAWVVGRAMVAVVPFTVLAIIAEAVGWNAVSIFAPAALAAVAYAAGAETIRLGGGRIVNMIIPGIGSFLFSMLWLLLGALPEALR